MPQRKKHLIQTIIDTWDSPPARDKPISNSNFAVNSSHSSYNDYESDGFRSSEELEYETRRQNDLRQKCMKYINDTKFTLKPISPIPSTPEMDTEEIETSPNKRNTEYNMPSKSYKTNQASTCWERSRSNYNKCIPREIKNMIQKRKHFRKRVSKNRKSSSNTFNNILKSLIGNNTSYIDAGSYNKLSIDELTKIKETIEALLRECNKADEPVTESSFTRPREELTTVESLPMKVTNPIRHPVAADLPQNAASGKFSDPRSSKIFYYTVKGFSNSLNCYINDGSPEDLFICNLIKIRDNLNAVLKGCSKEDEPKNLPKNIQNSIHQCIVAGLPQNVGVIADSLPTIALERCVTKEILPKNIHDEQNNHDRVIMDSWDSHSLKHGEMVKSGQCMPEYSRNKFMNNQTNAQENVRFRTKTVISFYGKYGRRVETITKAYEEDDFKGFSHNYETPPEE